MTMEVFAILMVFSSCIFAAVVVRALRVFVYCDTASDHSDRQLKCQHYDWMVNVD